MQKVIDAERFKKFVIENKLVSNAAGWVVAVSSTVLIQSSVGDVLLPSLYFTILFLMQKIGIPYDEKSGYLSIFEKVNKINLSNFIKELLSFAIMLTILYYTITFVINNLIDEKGNYKQAEAPKQDETPKQAEAKPEIVTLQAVNHFSPYG